MRTKITIERSDAWVTAQRLASGNNVEKYVAIDVEVGALSQEARAILLNAGSGHYQDAYPHLGYGKDYNFCSSHYSSYGRLYPKLDMQQQDVSEAALSDAIAKAGEELGAKQKADHKERIEREQARRTKAERWANLPLSHRVSADGVGFCAPMNAGEDYRGPLYASGSTLYDRGDLQQFVPEAYAEAQAEFERLRDKALLAEYKQDVKTLAEFLAAVPQDALRGTLKALAKDNRDELRKKVEAAAPASIVIFEDEEEDDDQE